MANEDTARYADIFAALGSEPRLEIMRLLFTAYPQGLTVGEIQEKLKIPNSTLSHHLEKLRIEGLVNCRKDKQFSWYSANAETMEDLLSFLYTGKSRKAWEQQASTATSTQEGFMFAEFFRPIFDTLYSRLFIKASEVPNGIITKCTETATNVIQLSQQEARRLRHNYIGTEQILLGLIEEQDGVAGKVLKGMGVHILNARAEVEKIIGYGLGTSHTEIPFTPRAKRVLELALEESERLGHNYIGTEHFLLGILRERGGLAVRVLENLGVNLPNLEQQLRGAIN